MPRRTTNTTRVGGVWLTVRVDDPRHLCDTITGDVAARILTARFGTILAVSQRSDARDEGDRRRLVADRDALAALDLKLEQLSDPDVRSVVIRHEHPEFEEALREGRREIERSDGPMNPRLHLTMHEIVATQLWDDSPPEVWDTAARLRGAGYERHEILHMLARPVSDQVWGALQDERPYDHGRHVAALQALPGAWERDRTARTAARRGSDATVATDVPCRRSRRLGPKLACRYCKRLVPLEHLPCPRSGHPDDAVELLPCAETGWCDRELVVAETGICVRPLTEAMNERPGGGASR